MYRNYKKHIYYPIIGTLIIVYTLGGVAWAINTLNEGWQVLHNTTVRLNIYSECKDVGSLNYDAFVPTKSSAEWSAFKSNKPSDIYVGDCGCLTGGNQSDIVVGPDTYTVHVFNTSQNATVNCAGLPIDYLIVGGGGGGGNGQKWDAATSSFLWVGAGGGGGAGGMTWGSTNIGTGTYSVTVGAGGARAGQGQVGGDGGSSSFLGMTMLGGGGGGSYPTISGRPGGAGGGGGQTDTAGGAGTSGQGYGGGSSTSNTNCGAGGGGGGRNGAGGSVVNSSQGGNGGPGYPSSITGTPVYYAGGGGGAANNSSSDCPTYTPGIGLGGIGGGGNGSPNPNATPANAGDGVDGTGGGGGGGNGAYSGRGGRGVVIVRYRSNLHTITFNGNGGTGHSPANKTVKYYNPVGLLPSNPTRAGYTFMGWFTAPSGGTQISANTQVTGDATYYAQWLMNASWEIGDWSACSASPTWVLTSGWSTCSDAAAGSCGGGTQTRTRVCQNTSGTQTRTVICRLSDGNVSTDSYCEQFSPKPATSQGCSASCSGSTTESQSCNTECYARWQRAGGGFTSCNGLGNYAVRCYNGTSCNVGYGNTCGYYNNGASTTWWPSGVAETITCRVYTNSSCTNPR